MPGGVIQLISTGNHDVYISGCPQITFFKKVYKKYTKFAIESIEQEFNGPATFNSYISATLARDADLLTKLTLEMKLSASLYTSLSTMTSVNGYITLTNSNQADVSNGTYYGTFSYGDDEPDTGDFLQFDSSSLSSSLDTPNTIFIGDLSGTSPSSVNITKFRTNIIADLTGSSSQILTLADVDRNQPRLATRIIDYIELTIGGQLIDRLYGEWIDIWLQLSSSYEKWTLLENMLYGNNLLLNNQSLVYLPIPFWFSKNYGLALPMISLQYHEVKCNIQFKKEFNGIANLYGNDPSNNAFSKGNSGASRAFTGNASNIVLDIPIIINMNDSRLFGDYIFLDTDERRLFANLKQEYLIEQTQYSNKLSLNSGININELHFNHPVKELFWFYQLSSNNDTFNYWDNSGNDIMKSCKLEYNGIERFKTKNNHYFRLLQPYFHHSGGYLQDISGQLGGFYTYSFGLHPEQYQPTGTCNFSRINNAIIYSNVTQDCIMSVYATNYNVLRVMNGMAGLGYGN
jgi:hypothetical protein